MPGKPSSRTHEPALSENVLRRRPPKLDARVRRTRGLLGEALFQLMREQRDFHGISIRDVIGRAGVARSTFYAHYRDMDDLFLTDVEDFFNDVATYLSRRREVSQRVAPVLELFSHVAEMSDFWAALIVSRKVRDVLDLAQGYMSRSIDERLQEHAALRALPPPTRLALSAMLAGSLLSLLTWWMDDNTRGTPAEMDDLYHALVWRGVDLALQGAS